MAPRIFVHIVTFESAAVLGACLDGLEAQRGVALGEDFLVRVTDNASTDRSVEIALGRVKNGLSVRRNDANLGFCGGHNQGAKEFLDSGAEYFLVLNPDVKLAPDALATFVREIQRFPEATSACIKLYRSATDLSPLRELDSVGMVLTASLRHFDRGADEEDRGQYDKPEYVFGGTGACLFLSRRFVLEAELEAPTRERDIDRLYPQLGKGREERFPLFDEGFFAYREDADLAWRAQRLGLRCIYLPTVTAAHLRRVTPERRRALPAEINLLGVRNRFLLQLNNYSPGSPPGAFGPGVIFRNILVVAGVLLRERSSIPALRQLVQLAPRALERRSALLERSSGGGMKASWLGLTTSRSWKRRFPWLHLLIP